MRWRLGLSLAVVGCALALPAGVSAQQVRVAGFLIEPVGPPGFQPRQGVVLSLRLTSETRVPVEMFLFGLPDVSDGTASDFRTFTHRLEGLGVCMQASLGDCSRSIDRSQLDPTVVAPGDSVILTMRFQSQATSIGDFLTFTARIGLRPRGQGSTFEARNINLPRIPVSRR